MRECRMKYGVMITEVEKPSPTTSEYLLSTSLSSVAGEVSNKKDRKGDLMVYQWELEKIKDWTTNKIKNHIWAAVDCG